MLAKGVHGEAAVLAGLVKQGRVGAHIWEVPARGV